MTLKVEYFPISGGLDLVTSPTLMNPGAAVYLENFEVTVDGAYQRADGYDRWSNVTYGDTFAPDESYWVLEYTSGSIIGGLVSWSGALTVTGGTSSATAKAFYNIIDSGSYGGGTAVGRLLIRKISGTFVDGETCSTASGNVVASGTALKRAHADDIAWLEAAKYFARNNTSKPTGSGSILGVWRYGGKNYCIRRNGSAATMYVDTGSAWTAVNLGYYVDFTAGTGTWNNNASVTGGTSGATGTVKAIVVTSGSFGGSNAAGYLIFTSITGTFSAAETLTNGGGGTATCSGAQTANSLTYTKNFKFINYNFTGASGSVKMYGVNGVNKAFQFDGTVFIPIRTGMTTDTPNQITAHKNRLFLGFPNGSVQHSSAGDPFTWSAVVGASEIAVGADITGFQPLRGEALGIATKKTLSILYGSSVSDWNLVTYGADLGVHEWSMQDMDTAIFLDSLGIRQMADSANFSNFSRTTVSRIVAPFLKDRLELITASCVSREKSQYRLFFSDGTAIYLTWKADGTIGFSTMKFPHVISSACSVKNADDTEEWILAGTTTGHVMRLDAGNSFGGEKINAVAQLAFNHSQSPQSLKKYHKVVLDIETQGATDLMVRPVFDYNSRNVAQSESINASVEGSQTGYWNLLRFGSKDPVWANSWSWETTTIDDGYTIVQIRYLNSAYFAVGTDGSYGVLLRSIDGVTWAAIKTDFAWTVNDIAYYQDTYVVGGATGVVQVSTDLITWTTESTHSGAVIKSFVSDGASFLAYMGTLSGSTTCRWYLIYGPPTESPITYDWDNASADYDLFGYGRGYFVLLGGTNRYSAWTVGGFAATGSGYPSTWTGLETDHAGNWVAVGHSSGATPKSFYSTDDGVTWTESSDGLPANGTTSRLVRDKIGTYHMIVDDTHYVMSDLLTWRPKDTVVASQAFTGLAVDQEGQLVTISDHATASYQARSYNDTARDVSEATVRVDGHGRNISLIIRSNSNKTDPFTLKGVYVHYSDLGLKKS